MARPSKHPMHSTPHHPHGAPPVPGHADADPRARAESPRSAPMEAAADPSLATGDFEHPLSSRYASREMSALWSPQHRYSTWRRIWVSLAEAQHELGLPISPEQIREMQAAIHKIDLAAAAAYEARTRHDVVAHIRAFGDAAPSARGIIHMGATSMDVVDNADLMLMREALELLIGRLAAACSSLAEFCDQYADLPALGYTHLQPAQLTTVGKRAALWLNDLLRDLANLEGHRAGLACRGLRGATGTQASFLKLLGGEAKVNKLEESFARNLGFDGCFPVVGQTYSRKIDAEIVFSLASLASGIHKMCNDIRLLAMLKQMDEPFEQEQVGSSAMPYKRNPALCERATGIARYMLSLCTSPVMTHAAQMLERTLDDSSNKRLVIPEAFLAADALLVLLGNIVGGLVVYPATIAAQIAAELPFIVTEEILMEAVARGGDRQELHERLRQHSQAAGAEVKQHGRPNDLIARLQRDEVFARLDLDWHVLLDSTRHVGLAPQQTRAFLREVAEPMLEHFARRMIPPPKLVV